MSYNVLIVAITFYALLQSKSPSTIELANWNTLKHELLNQVSFTQVWLAKMSLTGLSALWVFAAHHSMQWNMLLQQEKKSKRFFFLLNHFLLHQEMSRVGL